MSLFFQRSEDEEESKLERIWNIILIVGFGVFILYQVVDGQLKKRSFENNRAYTVARLQFKKRDSEDRWLEYKFYHQGYEIETWSNAKYNQWSKAQKGGFYLVSYDSTNPGYAQLEIGRQCLSPRALVSNGVKVPVDIYNYTPMKDGSMGINYRFHYMGRMFESYALLANFESIKLPWSETAGNGQAFLSICPFYPLLNDIELISSVNSERLGDYLNLDLADKLPKRLY